MDSPSKQLLEDTQHVCSRLAAHEDGAVSMVAVVESFDDSELTGLLQDASRLRAETDALITTAAGVIAKRSERALGYAGLAQREGHRTPTAMVQAITGTTRAEAARQVRLGEALGEADAAERLRAACIEDGDGSADDNGKSDHGDDDGPRDPSEQATWQLPWYQPVTEAINSHTITAESGAAILRGLGRPDDHVTAIALRAAAMDVLAETAELNVDETMKRARWARDAIDPVGVEDRARQRREART